MHSNTLLNKMIKPKQPDEKKQYRVLFMNQPSTGHVNTLLSIALQMREEGHSVQFLIPDGEKASNGLLKGFSMVQTVAQVPRILQEHNLPFDSLSVPIKAKLACLPLTLTTGYSELCYAMNLFNIGIKHYVISVIEYLALREFDVLVTDFAFISGHLAAEVTGIPCAVVYYSGLPFKGDVVPPFGSGLPIGDQNGKKNRRISRREKRFLRHLDGRCNKVRAKWHLEPMAPEYLRRPYSHWLNLVMSSEVIEAPRDNLSDNTFYVGPCFSHRKQHKDGFSHDLLDKDKFKIYVSLGTVFNNKPHVFEKIIKGLNHKDYQVIVSAGGAYKALKRLSIPDNVVLLPWVQQTTLLPLIDMVISHGGNNTTNETLAAGKPLIVMPVGGEQADNARRVEYLEAGLTMALQGFSSTELAYKVAQIKDETKYLNRVSEIKQVLDKTDGARIASQLIQRLAQTQQSLIRPNTLPLSLTLEDSDLLKAL